MSSYTSRSPSTSSRAAARARMRERAAANAKKCERIQQEHLSESRSDSPQVSAKSSPVRRPKETESVSRPSPGFRTISDPAAVDRPRAHPYAPVLNPSHTSRHNIQTTIYEYTVRPQDGSPDLDRPLVLSRPSSHEDGQSDGALGGGSRHGRVKKVRSRVRLYRDPDDESTTDSHLSSARERDPGRHCDCEFDSPYIPGSSSESNLRCLTWLRSVPKNGDFCKPLD
ncbi:hypothetical protein BDZ97DRAFT_1920502 [Flammula alnicola]|nr:hypothetical protein BDZ97DRAFT_1920502 [Flammula alnicola]